MAAEDLDDAVVLEEGDLEELDDELVDDEVVDDDDVVIDVDVVDDDDEDEGSTIAPDAKAAEEEDDDVPDADDVEASLDVILKERLVVEDIVEDEEAPEPDERGEGTERVLPKQSDEFVCASCFLVKNTNQLADKKKGLCRDCV